MKSTDPEFEYLVDIIQTTPQPRINRQDAWFIAERLVESGAIREDFRKPTRAEEIATAVKVFGGQDNLAFKTVEARAKGYVKPEPKNEHTMTFKEAQGYIAPYPPNRDGIPWDIDNNRAYEDWEIELLGGVEGKWAKFRNNHSPEMQQAILRRGARHPNHPEHQHEDCCEWF